MPADVFQPALNRAQIDPLRSPVLQRELPGLAEALDEQPMRERLNILLFGADSSYVIERCNPGQAIYLGGDFCGLRYEMEVRDNASGARLEPLIIGRVFQSSAAGASFLQDRLAAVAARMNGRPETAAFTQSVAHVDELNLVVHAFPIDGDLPILVDLTDERTLPALLSTVLPAARTEGFTARACRVELAHYGRQHRCTLRYTLTDGASESRVIYGKIAADGSGARTAPVIRALREQLSSPQIHIPQVLAFRPDLQLLLLEAIPGKPQVARLLKSRLAGKPQDGALTLENAIAACGRIAATMHGCSIAPQRQRTLADELDWLGSNIQALGRVSPDLGARLQSWLAQATAYAGRSAPLPLCFSHGDFTYTQLIFDGDQSGLVDFDTVCSAEPALDLGQFLAYQRLAILKDQRQDMPLPSEATERLCDIFLDTYGAARDGAIGDERQLRQRVALYEVLMLLRLAIHSWQKLKVSRLEHALTLLEERLLCLQ